MKVVLTQLTPDWVSGIPRVPRPHFETFFKRMEYYAVINTIVKD